MSGSDLSSVLLKIESGIAHLTVNRPEAMNAIHVPMADAFLAQCQAIAQDPSVRVVVLRGAGKAFGVGGDLATLQTDSVNSANALISRLHEAVLILARLNAPVIASLHGVVAGGSLSLSSACDLAIAAQGTRFNLAYANVAASCDVSASWSLPRLVGLRNVLQMALLSDTFDAQEALRLGLVNRVVPAEALEAEVSALANCLAQGPTLAYGKLKRLMRESFQNTLEAQLEAERTQFMASAQTADFKEALDAFLSKRKPNFKGE